MACNIYLIDNGDEIYKCITKLFQKEKDYKIHKAKTNQIEIKLIQIKIKKNQKKKRRIHGKRLFKNSRGNIRDFKK